MCPIEIVTEIKILIDRFWAYGLFETVFQSISGRLLERGRKREIIDDRKKSPNYPTRKYSKGSRPKPYYYPGQ